MSRHGCRAFAVYFCTYIVFRLVLGVDIWQSIAVALTVEAVYYWWVPPLPSDNNQGRR